MAKSDFSWHSLGAPDICSFPLRRISEGDFDGRSTCSYALTPYKPPRSQKNPGLVNARKVSLHWGLSVPQEPGVSNSRKLNDSIAFEALAFFLSNIIRRAPGARQRMFLVDTGRIPSCQSTDPMSRLRDQSDLIICRGHCASSANHNRYDGRRYRASS
jgi:hypothetical protein